MRVTAKTFWWLVPLCMLGCGHKSQPAKTQALAPPIVDTPPSKPSTVSTADLPPPVMGTPAPAAPANDASTPPPSPPAKKPVHHPKKPATPATATSATQDTAANPAPTPGVSAIGQLSEGSTGDLRTRTEDSIQTTEKGVNAITRVLSDQEQKTVAQIREFLRQARQALTTSDVDGAHTLVEKAKVLLAELNQ